MYSIIKFCIVGLFVVYTLGTREGEDPVYDKIIIEAKENYLAPLTRMGIQCPEVVVAQIVLETDYLRSKIYRENNNLFGMKESSRNWDIGSQYGHAKYVDRAHSVLDYREWQAQRSKGRVFKNNEEYIYFLGHLWKNSDGSWARYAEDPNYEEKLRVIIKKMSTHE